MCPSRGRRCAVYVALLCALCGLFNALLIPQRVTDGDGSQFIIKRLPNRLQHHNSCYEIVKANTAARFCYPSINIVGFSKCGTSALFMLFARNPNVLSTVVKEYCQRDGQLLFDYFRGFPTPRMAATRKFIVNGCNIADEKNIMHQKLLKPKTTNLLLVRSKADREWAAFNFWCLPSLDSHCPPGGWTKKGMYRSPELFDELLKAALSPGATGFKGPHTALLHNEYTALYDAFANNVGHAPLMMASEALSSHTLRPALLHRLQSFINSRLGGNITLHADRVHHVNTGNNRGIRVVSQGSSKPDAGLYEISGYRPMLNSTRDLLMLRWAECPRVSQLADFHYDCVPTERT